MPSFSFFSTIDDSGKSIRNSSYAGLALANQKKKSGRQQKPRLSIVHWQVILLLPSMPMAKNSIML